MEINTKDPETHANGKVKTMVLKMIISLLIPNIHILKALPSQCDWTNKIVFRNYLKYFLKIVDNLLTRYPTIRWRSEQTKILLKKNAALNDLQGILDEITAIRRNERWFDIGYVG